MECDIMIREARPQDERARAELIQSGITSYDLDAIVYFVFQELMLQLSVLSGAVLFIFAGAPLSACALAPLALAAMAAGAVLVAHRTLACRHADRLKTERVGFVAELRARPDGGRGRLVGTLSVSECEGAPRSGWLHALAVESRYRRRGAGRALLAAARAHAARSGLESLEAAVSALQTGARALLHAAGWRLRGAYHRRVLGRALTLPVLRLALDLPHA